MPILPRTKIQNSCNPKQNFNDEVRVGISRTNMTNISMNSEKKTLKVVTTFLSQKNQNGEITLPDSKLYYKAPKLKLDSTGIEKGHLGEENRIVNPEIGTH